MSSSFDQSSFAATTMDTQSGASDEGSYGYLGRYRLDRMIGHGAMGAVFEAFDATLGRTIAIKTLYTQPDAASGGFDSAMVDGAILQEARAAATLNHPNIVTVYDAGRAASSMLKRDLPYVAMELLQGVDLRQRIATGPAMGQREAVALIGKLALALDHAHKSGVMHRDIKPANVFMSKTNGPKILDFGLAKFTVRATQAAQDGNAASSSVIAGSPQYMSPEMVHSVNDPKVVVDSRSDIYSLGVMLYELLCGQKPFTAPTLELLQERIARTPAEPPHVVNPAIPLDLSSIVLNALAKKPEDRYRSAGQLARELRRWGAGSHEAEADNAHPAPNPAQSEPGSLGHADKTQDLSKPAPLDPASGARGAAAAANPGAPSVGASINATAGGALYSAASAALASPWANAAKKISLPKVLASLACVVALGAAVWLWLSMPSSVAPSQALAAKEHGKVAAAAAAAAAAVAVASAAAAPPAPPTAAPTAAAPPAEATSATALPATALPALASAPASSSSTTVALVTPPTGAAAQPAPSTSVVASASASAATTTVATATAAAPDTPASAAPTNSRLRIAVTPWGEVELDGKKMGVSPPLTSLTLEPGEHVVVLRNTDFAPRTFRIKVEAGKNERVSHKFE